MGSDIPDLLPEACPESQERWFVLRVETSREVAVSERLADRGIENFTPTYTVSRGNRARAKALYPGYLFGRFHSQCELYLALNTPRVIGLLRFGREAATLPNSDIEELRRAIESGEVQQAMEEEGPPRIPSMGNTVAFRYGLLAGQIGVVERVEVRRKKLPKIWIRIGQTLTREDGCERLRIVDKAA